MLGVTSLSGRVGKRTIDIVGALVGIVLAFPLVVLAGIAIKMDTPGPVFFRQDRTGKGGRPFRIWKLRTLEHASPGREGPGITLPQDSRITRVGSWLRATKVDELPQLLNVLAGEMSLVGPRPELPEFTALYSDRERHVLDFRPGITDPASLAYRNEAEALAGVDDWRHHYVNVVMRDKLGRNLDYLDRATVLTDIGVLLRTVVLLLGDGIGGRR